MLPNGYVYGENVSNCFVIEMVVQTCVFNFNVFKILTRWIKSLEDAFFVLNIAFTECCCTGAVGYLYYTTDGSIEVQKKPVQCWQTLVIFTCTVLYIINN